MHVPGKAPIPIQGPVDVKRARPFPLLVVVALALSPGVGSGLSATGQDAAGASSSAHQPAAGPPSQTVPLVVPTGVPLRLYITRRVSKRANAPVEAKLLEPVFAFDHEVLPAGARVTGRVSRIQPVPRWERLRAVVGGDFTPLHVAQLEFTSVVLPDGRTIQIHTISSPGLGTMVPIRPPKPRPPPNPRNNGGVINSAKQTVTDQARTQIDRIRSIPDLVRGPDKRELLFDFLMTKLPYHPQYLHSRTRFDAELAAPLDFGSESINPASLSLLGSQPDAGSVVHARLLTPLDSAGSTVGQKVEAVLEQPLFSASHQLILPEGTHVDGSVVLAKKAGWFHHGGRLRFNFQSVELPEIARFEPPAPASPPPPAVAKAQPEQPEKKLQFRTQATLAAVEGGKTPLKVDTEGGVQATESKTRFIGTAVALLVARAAADNDAGRAGANGGTGAINGQSSNIGGRTMGGGLGFGLIGSIAAQSSRNVGAAFGYYGLAWTVYSTVVARGLEVQFQKNAVVDIGFNARTATASTGKPPAGTAPKHN